MGSAPRPADEVSSHDAWSRRWGTMLGTALVLGAMFPLLRPTRGGSGGVRCEWPWEWSDARGPGLAVMFWLPLALGATAVLASRVHRPGPRAVLLFVVSLVAWTTSLVLLSVFEALGYLGSMRAIDVAAVAVSFAGAVVPLAIAVGNHVRRRFPDSRSARRMAGVGGVVVLACFVVPVYEGRAAISALLESRSWDQGLPMMIVFCGSVAYALLGALSFSRGRATRVRCLLLSGLGRALLFGLPLALVGQVLKEDRGRSDVWIMISAGVVKGSLLVYGHVLLIAVGLAAWMDATLARRSAPEPLDPARVDQVFG